MTKLDCSVTNCTYNSDNSCKRNDIKVEGNEAHMASETNCSSFVPKGCGCGASNMSECAKKDTDVSCSATSCIYNESKKCSANHIGIAGTDAGNSSDTLCRSFVCQ